MGMKASHVWFCMLLILMCSVSYSSGQCSYRVHVKTGDQSSARTTDTVSLSLCSAPNFCFFRTRNLARFGTSKPPYFQRGNNDTFEIRSWQSCPTACRISIGHSNAGITPRLYLDNVIVSTFVGSLRISTGYFRVFQWLRAGLQVNVNNCPREAATAQLASVLPMIYDFA